MLHRKQNCIIFINFKAGPLNSGAFPKSTYYDHNSEMVVTAIIKKFRPYLYQTLYQVIVVFSLFTNNILCVYTHTLVPLVVLVAAPAQLSSF